VDMFVAALDLGGTFVFALSGALLGVRRKLDIFGVLVLSFVAGNAGGIARDVLIGNVPPAGIGDWRNIGVSLLGGLLTFCWHPAISRLRAAVLVFDAAGLSLFAVSGALTALSYHLNPLAAILLGALTGIGGGMLRDILVANVPTVLHSELYAVAALAGAAVVVVGGILHLPTPAVAVAGAALCFALRIIAIRRGWHLPVARQTQPSIREVQDADSRVRRAEGGAEPR
jgi:uncharacterized membrane protein YeiH